MSLYGMSYMLSVRYLSALALRLKPMPGNHSGTNRTELEFESQFTIYLSKKILTEWKVVDHRPTRSTDREHALDGPRRLRRELVVLRAKVISENGLEDSCAREAGKGMRETLHTDETQLTQGYCL